MAAATIRWASRSTSCSRRSTTTRPPRFGAWTSPSAPPRAPTTRRAPCWRLSIFRSGSEAAKASDAEQRGELDGEEEFDREEQPAAPDGEKIVGPARAAEGDREGQDQAGRRTFRRDAEARRNAAQLVGHPHPQSLRADGAAARLLSQTQAFAHRAAGARLEGADPGPREVELVRRIARCR